MPEVRQSKVEQAVEKATQIVTNKKSRSVIFLLLSLLIVLGINGVLPVIEGQAQYTVSAIDRTYGEYEIMKAENVNYRLTWFSQQNITLYITTYVINNPGTNPFEVEIPDNFKVQVYTQFFFEYPFWYVSTTISIGSAIILFYSLFNYLIVLAKDKYKRYVDLSEQVEEMTEKHLDPVTFEPWIHDVFNYHRKIQQHKTNVKYSIDKLEQKTTYEIRKKLKPYFETLRNKPEDAALLLKTIGKLSWKERGYIKNKERLLQLLDDSYIKEYVVDGHVKHFKYISPMFVYNGSDNSGLSVDSYSLINSNEKRIAKDAGSRFLWALINTFLFAILFTVTAVSSYQQDPFWIVVNAISKIAPLVLQIPLAIDYSNVFMDTQLINNLISRRAIGLLYLADVKKEIPKGLKEVPNAKTN
jgi:hypothetical protein